MLCFVLIAATTYGLYILKELIIFARGNAVGFLAGRIPPLVFILCFAYFVTTFSGDGPAAGRLLLAWMNTDCETRRKLVEENIWQRPAKIGCALICRGNHYCLAACLFH